MLKPSKPCLNLKNSMNIILMSGGTDCYQDWRLAWPTLHTKISWSQTSLAPCSRPLRAVDTLQHSETLQHCSQWHLYILWQQSTEVWKSLSNIITRRHAFKSEDYCLKSLDHCDIHLMIFIYFYTFLVLMLLKIVLKNNNNNGNNRLGSPRTIEFKVCWSTMAFYILKISNYIWLSLHSRSTSQI